MQFTSLHYVKFMVATTLLPDIFYKFGLMIFFLLVKRMITDSAQ